MAKISAAEAQQIIREAQHTPGHYLNNNNVHLPATLPRLRRLMEEEYCIICNVGPWERLLETSLLKSFPIPAYDPAKDTEKKGYVESPHIPLVFRFSFRANEDNYGYYEDSGRQVAEEAIGIGFGLHPSNSIVKEGFFVPADVKPTPAEIAAANAALFAYYDFLIAEAREADDKGPVERGLVIGERHITAARAKGINERWVHHKHSLENVRCDNCGTFNPRGVAQCSKCGIIIDFEQHFRIQSEQKRRLAEYEALEAATRPEVKPERPERILVPPIRK